MKSQENRDVQSKFEAVEQSELAHVGGGVDVAFAKIPDMKIVKSTFPGPFPLHPKLVQLLSKPY